MIEVSDQAVGPQRVTVLRHHSTLETCCIDMSRQTGRH
jgi:hypothetical protein